MLALLLALAADPLPSWNDGPAKKSLLDFVSRVTKTGGEGYVRPAERVAVFDNDGTLWCEQPLYVQAAFTFDRVKEMASSRPEWKGEQPFKAVLEGDRKALATVGESGAAKLMAATHAGLTVEAFDAAASGWLVKAKHPRFGRLYRDLVYLPQLELLAFLRANDFKTFIVSGGGVDFIRGYAEEAYGVPPERVVGSSGRTRFEVKGGKTSLVKLPELGSFDDGPGKPVNIGLHVGRRPILAFGNSDGDLPMLQYTADGPGPRLMLLLHHDDAEREYAYDRRSHVGRLDRALDEAAARKWTVVSMKRDFKAVFPPAR